ncbi:hypothetical protein MRB53_041525 [Persea americana]|nr:hypothetical protein MRB53_041525 [Persea americana]
MWLAVHCGFLDPSNLLGRGRKRVETNSPPSVPNTSILPRVTSPVSTQLFPLHHMVPSTNILCLWLISLPNHVDAPAWRAGYIHAKLVCVSTESQLCGLFDAQSEAGFTSGVRMLIVSCPQYLRTDVLYIPRTRAFASHPNIHLHLWMQESLGANTCRQHRVAPHSAVQSLASIGRASDRGAVRLKWHFHVDDPQVVQMQGILLRLNRQSHERFTPREPRTSAASSDILT